MTHSSDRGDEIIHVIFSNIVRQDIGYLTEQQVWVWVVGGDDDDYHNSNVSTWFNSKLRIIINYRSYCRRLMDFLMTKCWSSGKSSLFLTGQLESVGVSCTTCVQGRRGNHHYRGAGSGHENIRLVSIRGRVAGADRRGGPGW